MLGVLVEIFKISFYNWKYHQGLFVTLSSVGLLCECTFYWFYWLSQSCSTMAVQWISSIGWWFVYKDNICLVQWADLILLIHRTHTPLDLRAPPAVRRALLITLYGEIKQGDSTELRITEREFWKLKPLFSLRTDNSPVWIVLVTKSSLLKLSNGRNFGNLNIVTSDWRYEAYEPHNKNHLKHNDNLHPPSSAPSSRSIITYESPGGRYVLLEISATHKLTPEFAKAL